MRCVLDIDMSPPLLRSLFSYFLLLACRLKYDAECDVSFYGNGSTGCGILF